MPRKPDEGWTKAEMAMERSDVRSATFIVPRLVRLFPAARSALDIACGNAAWLSLLQRHGVPNVTGADRARHSRLHIDPGRFRELDPAHPFGLGRTFDLTLALNVAEYLPVDRAAGFIADLCATADVIVFCAAVPGQGDGIHERWPSYWSRLFAARGFATLDCLRPLIWTDSRVHWRYAQSLLCFVKTERLAEFSGLAGAATGPVQMLDMVHPRAELRPSNW
jgi:hypothetical protein